jgi:hypothetical protein
MSLQLEWVGIAEGAVFDARKALTLVGINQNVVRVTSLPSPWQTSIIVMAADDTVSGTLGVLSGTISIEIRDPSNNVVFSTTNKVVVEPAQSDIPGSMVAAALVIMQITQAGRYRVNVVLTPEADGEEESRGHKDIYVILDPEVKRQ